MPTFIYRASYEDRAKNHERAARNGAAAGAPSTSVLEAENLSRTSIELYSLGSAAWWLMEAIVRDKTLFGHGEVNRFAKIKDSERCATCQCGGERRTHSYTVDRSGISREEEVDDCALYARQMNSMMNT